MAEHIVFDFAVFAVVHVVSALLSIAHEVAAYLEAGTSLVVVYPPSSVLVAVYAVYEIPAYFGALRRPERIYSAEVAHLRVGEVVDFVELYDIVFRAGRASSPRPAYGNAGVVSVENLVVRNFVGARVEYGHARRRAVDSPVSADDVVSHANV